MNKRIFVVLALSGAATAFAAPRIESVSVQPSQPKFTGGKPPEVDVSVSISRGRFDSGNCDVRVDFGDGEGRNLDFGVASRRNVRHVYQKSGSYTVVARGTGRAPCEGAQQMPLLVTGAPEAKPEPKKKYDGKKAPAKKPAAKKKADDKKGPAKKQADDGKAPAKKAAPKKDEKKKDDSAK